ncbi:MAG: response regulator [Wenzhouxiangellaceae bacterium]|nr:response regulator [Wenzhouxiangellaceae bacterium]
MVTPLRAQMAVAPGWSMLHWGVEDGLPVNSINGLVQGENGYLWLATMDGLASFDGQRFKVYDSASHPGLGSNRLTRIEHDGNTLWLLSEDNRLVRHVGGRFDRIGIEHGLPDERVTELKRIDGRFWVGTVAGAAWWDGERFRALDRERWGDHTRTILGQADGTVWLASDNGRLGRWRDGQLDIEADLDETIWTLTADPVAGIWLGHRSGASRWHDGKLHRLPVAPQVLNDVIRIEFAPDGGMYLHGSVTLYRYRDEQLEVLTEPLYRSGTEPIVLELPGSDEFLVNHGNELHRAGERIFSSSARIDALLVDREGNVWVATAGDGLYRLRANPLAHYLGHADLGTNPAYPITTDNAGRIWVGTGGAGFFILDADGRVLDAAPAEQPMDMIYSLLPPSAPGEAAWIGGLGLHRWQSGEFSQQDIPDELALAMVYALYRDNHGTIWAGTHSNGLWRLDEDRWQRVELPADLAGARVRQITEGADGTLWMATNGDGVLRHATGRFERIGRGEGLPGLLVRGLHLDDRGRLWIGTETHGLCRIENPRARLDDLKAACIDRGQGIFHHGIHQVLEDHSGYFWMSSNRGIFRIRRATLDAALDAVAENRGESQLGPATFLAVEGLPNREANGGVQSAGTIGPDGRLWFPTMSGPVVIDPGQVGHYRIEPEAIIESVRTRNRDHAAGPAPIELPIGQRDLAFAFTAPSFVSPRNLGFEYRLVDYEQDWRGPVAHGQVEYTNLPHGDYRFEVRARIGAGAPGLVATQAIEIPPVLLERTSFYVVAVLALLAMVACAWRIREQRIRSERARLQTMVTTRTEELSQEKSRAELARDEIARQAKRLRNLDTEKRAFFANISHELRTPLTMLLGPLDQFHEDPERLAEQAPMMRRNARRLNRLVEQLLDLQRIEGGQLRISPELYDLVAWLESLADLFRPLAEQRRITIRLDLPGEGVLAWFDREQMEKILGNLISNAIRYCKDGDHILIEVRRQSETVRIKIADNGPGIPEHHLPNLFDRFYRAVDENSPIEGTGIGLALSRDLIELHGGQIEAESELGAGTSFTLSWPARAIAGHGAANDDRITPDRIAMQSITPDPHAGEQHEVDTDRARLLIVDDNADIREWLGRALGSEFELATAVDGLEALASIDQALPDLIICDWMMPNMDGIELIGKLAKRPDCDGLPIIMLTARGDVRDRIDAHQAGAVAFVAKPFNLELLRTQIDSILEQQLRLRRRLAESGRGNTETSEQVPESKFAREATEAIDRHLHDPNFGVEQLAAAMAMDRSVLFRRVRAEFSTNPSELLRKHRMELARELLVQREGNTSEVAYAVGFSSVNGFSRAFQRQFGMPPSNVIRDAEERACRSESTST